MKRIVRAIAGYALVTMFFVMLLALELCFIGWMGVAVVGIAVLVREPTSLGDAGLSISTAFLAALFGAVVLLSAALAVILPCVYVKGWRPAPNRPAGPAV